MLLLNLGSVHKIGSRHNLFLSCLVIRGSRVCVKDTCKHSTGQYHYYRFVNRLAPLPVSK